jgi:hypothetical protein
MRYRLITGLGGADLELNSAPSLLVCSLSPVHVWLWSEIQREFRVHTEGNRSRTEGPGQITRNACETNLAAATLEDPYVAELRLRKAHQHNFNVRGTAILDLLELTRRDPADRNTLHIASVY